MKFVHTLYREAMFLMSDKNRNFTALIVLALGFHLSHGGQSAVAEDVSHSFLACGAKTYIMDASGKQVWSYPASTRDGYVIGQETVILTLSKSDKHPGGAVVEVTRDGDETLIWEGTQSEVNSAQPTKDGTLVITEAGPNPRLLEISRSGKVLNEFALACQKDNHHMQTRMARKLADGTFLVPHLLDFAVFHYDSTGQVLDKLDTTMPGDTDHKIHTWPFTAIRHSDGHTSFSCEWGPELGSEPHAQHRRLAAPREPQEPVRPRATSAMEPG